MKKISVKHLFWLVLLFAVGWGSPCFAHKVYIFAWVEDGFVHSESSFGDKKVIKGKIEVADEKGSVILTGITDEKGNFSFKIPDNPASDLVLNLDASMGHQASWRVKLEEMEKAGSSEVHDAAMAKKAELERGPSFVRIASGIGVIFFLAFFTAFVQKKRRKKYDQ